MSQKSSKKRGSTSATPRVRLTQTALRVLYLVAQYGEMIPQALATKARRKTWKELDADRIMQELHRLENKTLIAKPEWGNVFTECYYVTVTGESYLRGVDMMPPVIKRKPARAKRGGTPVTGW